MNLVGIGKVFPLYLFFFIQWQKKMKAILSYLLSALRSFPTEWNVSILEENATLIHSNTNSIQYLFIQIQIKCLFIHSKYSYFFMGGLHSSQYIFKCILNSS